MNEIVPDLFGPTEAEDYNKEKLKRLYGHSVIPAIIPAISQSQSLISNFTPTLTPNPQTPDFPVSPLSPSARAYDPLFGIKDLVELWYIIHPDTPLHEWQKEELLRISGYVDGRRDPESFRHYFKGDAYRGEYPCANSSGKDRMIITTAAIGLPLLYRNTFVVITSSSYEQLKYQTNNHITRAIANLHAHFGGLQIYESVEFYHSCKERGAEIKLFVTDEAGRAEGWHPLTEDGRLVIIVNEAKSIPPPIFGALDRCYGYSHWLEVSSPGPRAGLFYKNFKNAVIYPAPWVPGCIYGRRVTADECPHITEQEKAAVIAKHGINSYIVQTSLFANFFEQEEDVVIPITLIESNETTVWQKGEIGIGLDSGAGGDETALYVRQGNKDIDKYFITFKDTSRTIDLIDDRLSPYKFLEYKFNADDGGVSRAIVDGLTQKGWKIRRVLNQSPAYQKSKYLNLGAEVWFHTRLLFERRLIVSPEDSKTINQLCTRRYDEISNQGKKALGSKREIRALGGESPDRADAYTLCFFSYRPDPRMIPHVIEDERPIGLLTTEELLRLSNSNPRYLSDLLSRNNKPAVKGTYTQLTQPSI